jgi:hypothetical protein
MNELEMRYYEGAFAARNPEAAEVMYAEQAEKAMKMQGSVAQAVGTIGSGILASAPAGIAGVASMPFVGMDGAQQIMQDIQTMLTYVPKDEEGQAMVQRIGTALESMGAPAKMVGEAVFEMTGSPAAATAAEILLDPLNIAGMAVGSKAIKAGAKAAGGAIKTAGSSVVGAAKKAADTASTTIEKAAAGGKNAMRKATAK